MRNQVAAVLLLLAGAGLAQAQLQARRVAADYHGRTILFESDAALQGEGEPSGERILELTDGQIAITATNAPGPLQSGVIRPMTNDHGHLRAYSYWERLPPGGARAPLRYVGVVRHEVDGWEIRRDGRVGLSQEGRWAVFVDSLQARTVWLDLWLDEEFVVEGVVLTLDRVADDGAVVGLGWESVRLWRPHNEPVEIRLPFQVQDVLVDRTGRWAAVKGDEGIYRVSLATGAVEEWMVPCDSQSCRIADISADGKALLYLEWGTMVVVGEPGRGHRWLHQVRNAAFTGDGRAAIANASEGLVRFEVVSGETEQILAGPVTLTTRPAALSPGLWVRCRGTGLSGAWITVNGELVEPDELRPDGLVWVTPATLAAGVAVVRMGQHGSPFEPYFLELPVHAGLPEFITRVDARPYIGDWGPQEVPYIRHADGLEVNGDNPARPGETILLVMTGLNGRSAAVLWSIEIDETAVYAAFESATPSELNPHWTEIRIRLPELLPQGTVSRLTAELDGVSRFAVLRTLNE